MNKLMITLVALSTLVVAAPAYAQNANFTGARVEAQAGFNDIVNSPDLNKVVYGAAVGFDLPVGNKFTVGVEANTANVFEKQRQFGAAARLGYAVTPNLLGYVRGGYSNYRDAFSRKLDGAVIGAGVQYAVSSHSYVKAEYNYSDLAANTGSHGAIVGVGIRF